MNKNNIAILISFATGVAVGVIGTYKVAEKKYRDIADEEIESVVAKFSDRKPLVINEDEEQSGEKVAIAKTSDGIQLKPDIETFRSTIAEHNYNQVSTQQSRPSKDEPIEEEPEVAEESLPRDIYTISPEEFDTIEGYRSETLYYTDDNYVVDDKYEPLDDEDIRLSIGCDPLGFFGEYEDDSVHIRNDIRMVDYEILRSAKTLDEIREGQ